MTKPKTKPCMCCAHYSGALPCEKGHKPRYYKIGGLRRVCDDWAAVKSQPAPSWIGSVLALFGFRR